MVTLWVESWLFGRSLSCRRRLPCWSFFVGESALRSAIVLSVWSLSSASMCAINYRVAWVVTEPFEIAAICFLAVEVLSKQLNNRPGATVYVMVPLLVVLVGSISPSHNRCCAQPVMWVADRLIAMRTVASISVCVALLCSAAWRERMPSFKDSVLLLFSFFDTVAYATLAVFPEWSKAPRNSIRLQALVMVLQGACWAAWAIRDGWPNLVQIWTFSGRLMSWPRRRFLSFTRA